MDAKLPNFSHVVVVATPSKGAWQLLDVENEKAATPIPATACGKASKTRVKKAASILVDQVILSKNIGAEENPRSKRRGGEKTLAIGYSCIDRLTNTRKAMHSNYIWGLEKTPNRFLLSQILTCGFTLLDPNKAFNVSLSKGV